MDSFEIRCVTAAEECAAVSIIVSAFVADPGARWLYPEPQHFLTQFPAFVRAVAGRAFARGHAHIAGIGRAAILWLPPGVGPDEEAVGAVVEATPGAAIRQDLFRIIEQMGSYHPAEPHWYLPFIAVDPPLQGQGLGSALLRHSLESVDRDRKPAYLEASNPKNVPLYERFGFQVTGTIQVGSAPPIYPMLRSAR
jgi:ribosomal protein S18 acetylase RimI-like enzyme